MTWPASRERPALSWVACQSRVIVPALPTMVLRSACAEPAQSHRRMARTATLILIWMLIMDSSTLPGPTIVGVAHVYGQRSYAHHTPASTSGRPSPRIRDDAPGARHGSSYLV